MGKYALLFPRLVNNAQLRITQTTKVCPRQLLNAALLAPPLLPRVVTSSSSSPGRQDSLISSPQADAWRCTVTERTPINHEAVSYNAPQDEPAAKASSVSDNQRTTAERTWEILEMHAVAALPSLRCASTVLAPCAEQPWGMCNAESEC